MDIVKKIALLATVGLAGCSQGDRTETDAVQTGSQVETRMTIPDNIIIASDENQPAPEGIVSGRFIMDQGCLFFEARDGSRSNPILTGNSTVAHDADGALFITLAGTPAPLMKNFRAAGGGSASATNLTDAQKACSSNIVILGGILEE